MGLAAGDQLVLALADQALQAAGRLAAHHAVAVLAGLEHQLHLELVLAAAGQTQAARPAWRADGDADSQQQGGLALVVLAEDTVEAAAEGHVDLLEAAEVA